MLKRFHKLRKIIYLLFSYFYKNLISLFSKRVMSPSGHGLRSKSEGESSRSPRWGEREKRENKDIKFLLIYYLVYILLAGCLNVVNNILLSPTQGRTSTFASRDVGVIHR